MEKSRKQKTAVAADEKVTPHSARKYNEAPQSTLNELIKQHQNIPMLLNAKSGRKLTIQIINSRKPAPGRAMAEKK